MAVLAWILALLVMCSAAVADEEVRPNAELRRALEDSARVVLRQGEALVRLGRSAGPQTAALQKAGRRLTERARTMAVAAEELSAQAEQAARSVRQQSAELAALAERMLSGEGPLPEVGRRLLVESERLKTAASEAPVVEPQEPFEGLATGVSEI